MGKTRACEHAEYGTELLARLFYSPHSFMGPETIIHMPEARITAVSTASRKSLRIFSSLSISNWLVCGAMTMRASAQIRRPLLPGGQQQHRLALYGVGQVSNRIVLGDETDRRR